MLRVEFKNIQEMTAAKDLAVALQNSQNVVVIQHFYDAAFMITDTGYVLTYHCDSGIEDIVHVSTAKELYAICTSHYDSTSTAQRLKINFTGHYADENYRKLKPVLQAKAYIIGCISVPDASDTAVLKGNTDIAVDPKGNLLLIRDDVVWSFDNFKDFIEFCIEQEFIANTILVQ